MLASLYEVISALVQVHMVDHMSLNHENLQVCQSNKLHEKKVAGEKLNLSTSKQWRTKKATQSITGKGHQGAKSRSSKKSNCGGDQ
ncbi:hypothetical protein K1719_031793 [Acacia pycnantha]|nr:hypothetical protein K1719_031793 [Acacia pycnantha]